MPEDLKAIMARPHSGAFLSTAVRTIATPVLAVVTGIAAAVGSLANEI